MTTATIIATALTDAFNIMGVEAIYNPAGGAPVACKVLLERDVLLQPTSMTAQVYDRGTILEVILADVGEEPDRSDTFTVGAETFTVQAIDKNDGYTVRIIVT